jgi:DNA-binding MarR family transcriptional regulator
VPNSLFLEQGQALRDLKTLEAIEQAPSISQRDLARQLGVALGVTNACLSKMARAGLIRISRVNGRSLAYHLTPAGFSAKAKLSMEYARATVDLYRTARQAVTEGIGVLAESGVTRIALLGAGDIAEIVGIVCAHRGITIVAIADENVEVQGTSFLGLTLVSMAELAECDCEAVIVTYPEDADIWMKHVKEIMPKGTPVMTAM